jgi:hypothetical protein
MYAFTSIKSALSSVFRKEACRQGHIAWEVGLVALYDTDQLEFAGMLLIL